MRALALLGSIMVGLVITNTIYLLFIREDDLDEIPYTSSGTAPVVFQLSTGGFAIKNGTSWVFLEDEEGDIEDTINQYTSVQVSSGMILLWSVGSALHAIWDNTIWYVTSCSCCMSTDHGSDNNDNGIETGQEHGRCDGCVTKYKKFSNILVAIGIIVITAVATVAVVIRSHVDNNGGDISSALAAFQSSSLSSNGEGTGAAGVDIKQLSNKNNYEYLMSYSIELTLAWFLWFPIIETILFSGILALPCPRLGSRLGLGGRPAEL